MPDSFVPSPTRRAWTDLLEETFPGHQHPLMKNCSHPPGLDPAEHRCPTSRASSSDDHLLSHGDHAPEAQLVAAVYTRSIEPRATREETPTTASVLDISPPAPRLLGLQTARRPPRRHARPVSSWGESAIRFVTWEAAEREAKSQASLAYSASWGLWRTGLGRGWRRREEGSQAPAC